MCLLKTEFSVACGLLFSVNVLPAVAVKTCGLNFHLPCLDEAPSCMDSPIGSMALKCQVSALFCVP